MPQDCGMSCRVFVWNRVEWSVTHRVPHLLLLCCFLCQLAPTYGGPINRMTILPRMSASKGGAAADEASAPPVVVYGTSEKVVGLVMMPLDGNPDTSMGLIAHPGEISAVAPTHDGRYVLTAGGMDCTVNLWSVDTRGLEQMAAKVGVLHREPVACIGLFLCDSLTQPPSLLLRTGSIGQWYGSLPRPARGRRRRRLLRGDC